MVAASRHLCGSRSIGEKVMTTILDDPHIQSRNAARSERIPVAVLGATGSVGQRFIQLLETHPWFRLHEVVASERSAGKTYGDAADWRLDTLLYSGAASLVVKPLGAELESRLVFSGLGHSRCFSGAADQHEQRPQCHHMNHSQCNEMRCPGTDPDGTEVGGERRL